MPVDESLEYLEDAMANLYVVRSGVVCALDLNPGTGAFGNRGVRTGRTALCRTLQTVDELHESLAGAICVARRGDYIGYERSRRKACAFATNKINRLPNKTNKKNFTIGDEVIVNHANDKEHHGREGTVVGTTWEYVHLKLYASRAPRPVIRKHNDSVRMDDPSGGSITDS